MTRASWNLVNRDEIQAARGSRVPALMRRSPRPSPPRRCVGRSARRTRVRSGRVGLLHVVDEEVVIGRCGAARREAVAGESGNAGCGGGSGPDGPAVEEYLGAGKGGFHT